MSCALCSGRDRSGRVRDDLNFHLLAATSAMGDLLAGILAEHRVIFDRRNRLFTLLAPDGKNRQDYRRIVALLRQVCSPSERKAISAFLDDGLDFPAPRTLDEWWRVFETEWFDRALSGNEFVTWFQPIVDTSVSENGGRRIFAYECLMRLCHGRVYGGAEIVDAARVRRDEHRFDAYARTLSLRSAASQSTAQVYFVNFMPSSIHNPELCLRSTLRTLEDSGLQPRNVVFEVMESELAADPAHLPRVCDYYRTHGFGFALDNVGTGSRNMQLVRELRPHYVKLDKCLAQNIERPLYAATIRKLVELADASGATVIAEGVERPHVMENLWLLGVQCMQGFLFGHPAPGLVKPERGCIHPGPEPQRVPALQDMATPALTIH